MTRSESTVSVSRKESYERPERGSRSGNGTRDGRGRTRNRSRSPKLHSRHRDDDERRFHGKYSRSGSHVSHHRSHYGDEHRHIVTHPSRENYREDEDGKKSTDLHRNNERGRGRKRAGSPSVDTQRHTRSHSRSFSVHSSSESSSDEPRHSSKRSKRRSHSRSRSRSKERSKHKEKERERSRERSRERRRKKRKDKERKKTKEERRSVLTGKKIKLKVHKDAEDLKRDANREDLLQFLNSTFD